MSRVVKVAYKGTIRRVQLEHDRAFQQLVEFVDKNMRQAPKDFVLSYVDEEGDACLVSSNVELDEAFRVSTLLDQKLLKLVLSKPPNEQLLAAAAPSSQKDEQKSAAGDKASPKRLSAPTPEHQMPTTEEAVNLVEELLRDKKIVETLHEHGTQLFRQLADERVPLSQLVEAFVDAQPALRDHDTVKKLLPFLPRFLQRRSNVLQQVRLLVARLQPILPSFPILVSHFVYALSNCEHAHIGLGFTSPIASPVNSPQTEESLRGVVPVFLEQILATVRKNNPDAPKIEQKKMDELIFTTKMLIDSYVMKDTTSFDLASGALGKSHPQAPASDKHFGIICDGCGAEPIIGTRFKCAICPNFDLCQTCEEKGMHDTTHVMIKIASPLREEPSMWSSGKVRPKAEFVCDVTIPSASRCLPSATLQKVWKVRNSGRHDWPAGIKLAFTDGSLAPAPGKAWSRHAVDAARPGQSVNVKVDFVAPKYPGRYIGNYRLCAPDKSFFGPRIWIDVIVVKTGDAALADEKTADATVKPTADATVKSTADATAKSTADATAKPSNEEPKEQFRFEKELQAVLGMGFHDTSLIKYLLITRKGNTQECVDWLLKNHVG